MVMISPCSGCDTTTLARILALFEAISGITTIIKSAWWYCFFRIPVKGKNTKRNRNPAPVSRIILHDVENPEGGGESCALSQKRGRPITEEDNEDAPQRVVDDVEIQGPTLTSTTPPESRIIYHAQFMQEGDQIEPDYASSETDSIASVVSDANADNVLWTLTGFMMGSINIALGLFLQLGLTNMNYVFLVGWCLSFPTFYLLDCILFTFLLKHCTSKDRFEKCRSHYISSTILSFIFNSYFLWVGISVLFWCNCRRDPYRCRFQRDYCFSSFNNFNVSDFGGSGRDGQFYDLNEIHLPLETMSF